MIHPNLKLVFGGALAVATLAACQNQQRDEGPGHPDARVAEPEPTTDAQVGAPSPAAAGPHGAGTTTGTTGATGTTGTTGSTAASDPDLLLITITSVDIDTRLAVLCRLPGSSVFFKFDSAQLQPAARERLQQIASCVTTGAAKGKDLLIVGRTDPSGPDQYNQQLSMSRAEAVARHLNTLGVQRSRVQIVPKGEEDVIQDPFGWPINRRVTIRLQQP